MQPMRNIGLLNLGRRTFPIIMVNRLQNYVLGFCLSLVLASVGQLSWAASMNITPNPAVEPQTGSQDIPYQFQISGLADIDRDYGVHGVGSPDNPSGGDSKLIGTWDVTGTIFTATYPLASDTLTGIYSYRAQNSGNTQEARGTLTVVPYTPNAISITSIYFTDQNSQHISMPAPLGTTAINMAWTTNINAHCTFQGSGPQNNDGTTFQYATLAVSNGFTTTGDLVCADINNPANNTTLRNITIWVKSPPTIAIDPSLNGQTFTAGSNVVISGTAGDADSNVLYVDIYENGTLLTPTHWPVTSAGPHQWTWSYTWTNVPGQGATDIKAYAVDDGTPTGQTESIPHAQITINAIPVLTIIKADVSAGNATQPLDPPYVYPNITYADPYVVTSDPATCYWDITNPMTNPQKADLGGTNVYYHTAGTSPYTDPIAAGTYTYYFQCNNGGTPTDIKPITFTIAPAPNQPTITIDPTLNGKTFTAGNDVVISGTAGDLNANVLYVDIYENGTLLTPTHWPVTNVGPHQWTWTYTWQNVPGQGATDIKAYAVDDGTPTGQNESFPHAQITINAAPVLTIIKSGVNAQDVAHQPVAAPYVYPTVTSANAYVITSAAATCSWDINNPLTNPQLATPGGGNTYYHTAGNPPYTDPLAVNTYTYYFQCTDGINPPTAVQPVSFTIAADANQPTITIDPTLNGKTFTAGNDVVISGTAGDTNANVLYVDIYENGTLLTPTHWPVTSAGPHQWTWSYTWTNVPGQGATDIKAYAIDDGTPTGVNESFPHALITINPSNGSLPLRANPQPTTDLPAGTKSIAMTLDTPGVVTHCNISATPGVDFSLMASQFDTNDAITHSVIVGSAPNFLYDGFDQTYYIRCRDNATGQTNTDDFPIRVHVLGDTAAPVRSNPQPLPGTQLPAGIGSYTMSLNTNEPAICNIATTPGTAFADMTGGFDQNPQYTTLHSVKLDTPDGVAWKFYVRCIDQAGNVNLDDYEIDLTVLAPVTLPPTPGLVKAYGAQVQANLTVLSAKANTFTQETCSNTSPSSCGAGSLGWTILDNGGNVGDPGHNMRNGQGWLYADQFIEISNVATNEPGWMVQIYTDNYTGHPTPYSGPLVDRTTNKIFGAISGLVSSDGQFLVPLSWKLDPCVGGVCAVNTVPAQDEAALEPDKCSQLPQPFTRFDDFETHFIADKNDVDTNPKNFLQPTWWENISDPCHKGIAQNYQSILTPDGAATAEYYRTPFSTLTGIGTYALRVAAKFAPGTIKELYQTTIYLELVKQ